MQLKGAKARLNNQQGQDFQTDDDFGLTALGLSTNGARFHA
jgi:hypothetical protein